MIQALEESKLTFNDPPRLIWVWVQEAVGWLWRDNPKLHSIGEVVQSIEKHGFQALPKYDIHLENVSGQAGAIKDGNGRIESLAMMERDGFELPRGLATNGERWAMPLLVGTDAKSRLLAESYAIDANNLTLAGGDLTGFDMLRLYDQQSYLSVLTRLAEAGENPVTVDGDMLDALILAANDIPLTKAQKGDQPDVRTLPIDMIYTLNSSNSTCCIAVQAGLKYGIQSGREMICANVDRLSGRHDVCFIDNDYFNYDHEVHLTWAKRFEPKYITTRDLMTKDQCRGAKIAYFSLEEVLDQAAELESYAQNIIVIPKYNCLDKIPERYILGYSVPTSHGGTPLPVEAFKGRRVHLLGGSWEAQLQHLAELKDDVVSVDNNYVHKQARFGSFVYPDGKVGVVGKTLGIPEAVNPYYIALAITVGNIAAKINELYKGEQHVQTSGPAVNGSE